MIFYNSVALSILAMLLQLFISYCFVTVTVLKYFAIAHILTGSDYIVNLQDIASRNFTVTFLSKQATSTEHVIQIADDNTSEGKEYFRLRITAVRPIGQAAQFFIPEPGVNETFVDITIEDDDSKSNSSFFATHYKVESELNSITSIYTLLPGQPPGYTVFALLNAALY